MNISSFKNVANHKKIYIMEMQQLVHEEEP